MRRSPGETRVLLSVGAPTTTTNPFITELVGNVGPDVRIAYFSWREALLGSYDVLHLHWPEFLPQGRSAPLTVLKSLLTFALVARIRVRRTAVVWTVHNERPHESVHRVAALAVTALMATVRTRVYLTEAHRAAHGRPDDAVVRHGDYPELRRTAARLAGEPPQFDYAVLGRLRSYKGVESFIRTFREHAAPTARLLIAGEPSGARIAEDVLAASGGDDRVEVRLGYLDDESLVRSARSARVVVIPYPRVLNSGVLMMSLSLGRPVLATASPTVAEIGALVGDGWVRETDARFEDELATGASLAAAAALDGREPDLSRLSWPRCGAEYERLYKALAA